LPGIHKIIVVVDEKNFVDELDETNNVLSFELMIINTSPNANEKQILITEFYYHAHTNLQNEYIKIFNPTLENLNISGWYFTDNPSKCKEDQFKN